MYCYKSVVTLLIYLLFTSMAIASDQVLLSVNYCVDTELSQLETVNCQTEVALVIAVSPQIDQSTELVNDPLESPDLSNSPVSSIVWFLVAALVVYVGTARGRNF